MSPDKKIPHHNLAENLELLARQVVEGFIIGLHKSPFHGFSVEFAEHRLYNPGDALRHIDWRVFGRTEKLFVKRFEEETNLRCNIVIDTSSSMHFPQEEDNFSKLEFSILSAAAILQLLKRQLDAGALSFFDETLYYISECRSSPTHYRMLMRELEKTIALQPANKHTNAAEALHRIAMQMHRRSLVIIFSDMMDDAEDVEQLFGALQHLKYNKHEVILFHIVDGKKETEFDFENRPYEFIDLESGERLKLQPSQVREQYIKGMKEYSSMIEERCHQYRIDRVAVDLRQPPDQVLHTFLARRNKMV